MASLMSAIMMFRELRESIQSEEDAAAVIRISRAREFKVKGLTTGDTEATAGSHRGIATALKTFAPQFMLAFSNSYSLKAERNERVSAFFSQSSGDCAPGHAGTRFRARFSARDPATTLGHLPAPPPTSPFRYGPVPPHLFLL